MLGRWLLACLAVALLAIPALAGDARIKDITRVYGTGENPVMGYGLVVGLPGTGDSSSSLATSRAVANLLARFGLPMSPDQIRSRNVAAVMVTGDLPAFASAGERVDVTVSSIGDARSLSGGTLLMSHLNAADGRPFVTAQGPLVAGESKTGMGPASAQRMLTARVPGGGLVLEDFTTPLARGGEMRLVLNQPDFATAQRIADAINGRVPAGAVARDASTVIFSVPPTFQGREAQLLSDLEILAVVVDSPARVVVNERTGTVVIGGQVRCSAVAISHGDLRLSIAGATPPAAGMQLGLVGPPQGGQGVALVRDGATIDEVVQALNALGASPKDLIDILQALKRSGALQAELEVQ